jgi:hypothetical protein
VRQSDQPLAVASDHPATCWLFKPGSCGQRPKQVGTRGITAIFLWSGLSEVIQCTPVALKVRQTASLASLQVSRDAELELVASRQASGLLI